MKKMGGILMKCNKYNWVQFIEGSVSLTL
ncbi:tetracycline resistance efflux system leader peptide [Lysinibacillus sphaericus]|uniref:Tetracycline resistance efflux system leader peptide n=1 Tax=Lysinibacillus sphaericus TaxID=1421 RepID=A0A544UQL1_LYSSH|nr:tetracycline resistance efflux system leader peptide [Lysinibacillus sp. SDF0037]